MLCTYKKKVKLINIYFRHHWREKIIETLKTKKNVSTAPQYIKQIICFFMHVEDLFPVATSFSLFSFTHFDNLFDTVYIFFIAPSLFFWILSLAILIIIVGGSALLFFSFPSSLFYIHSGFNPRSYISWSCFLAHLNTIFTQHTPEVP